MLRKIRRNIIKNRNKTNRIQTTWRRSQIKNFGSRIWLKMYIACSGKNLEGRIANAATK